MTAPARKFGSAATAAPVNCVEAEVFNDEEAEVALGVVVGGGVVFGGGVDFGGGVVCGGGEV